MRAAIFRKPFTLELLNQPVPKPGAHEIRVQVQACGVCATDHHIYAGEAPASPPVILGHEYVGVVADVGSAVTELKIGDRVAVDPNIHCGECSFCRRGAVHLCANLQALGVNRNGGFAEYALVPISQAYPIPNDFRAKWAAFAEPLSCCVHGIQQAAIQLNDTVAIVGGGAIGLLMIQLARLNGAGKVLVIEPIAERRALAKQVRADDTFDPNSSSILKDIQEITAGGADVVIECVGSAAAAELALKLARRGGRVVIFGLADKQAKLSLSLQEVFHRELTIKTSLLNPFTFQTAVDLLVSGKIQVEPLNPVTIPLEKVHTIFTQPYGSRTSAVKYQIVPDT